MNEDEAGVYRIRPGIYCIGSGCGVHILSGQDFHEKDYEGAAAESCLIEGAARATGWSNGWTYTYVRRDLHGEKCRTVRHDGWKCDECSNAVDLLARLVTPAG